MDKTANKKKNRKQQKTVAVRSNQPSRATVPAKEKKNKQKKKAFKQAGKGGIAGDSRRPRAADQALQAWMDMMVDSNANTVRAPNPAPILTSVARMVQTHDFIQGDGEGEYGVGDCVVYQRPFVRNSMYVTSKGFPDGLEARPITVSSKITFKDNNPVSGLLFYKDGLGNSFIGPLGPTGVAGWGLRIPVVIPTDVANDKTYRLSVTDGGGGNKVQYCMVNIGDATIENNGGTRTLYSSKSPVVARASATTENMLGAYLRLRYDNTFTTSGQADVQLEYFGNFPSGASPIHLDLLPAQDADLIDADHYRVTSMQMFVTDLSPALVASGEILSGRVNEHVIQHSTDVQNLKERIRRLPETRYWRSGQAKEGAYIWWLPDDLASYTPDALDVIGDANVNLAIFNLPLGGRVRVQCTYTLEFYTASQLFTRAYTPLLDDRFQQAWLMLASREACSSNYSHEDFKRDLEWSIEQFAKIVTYAEMAATVAQMFGML